MNRARLMLSRLPRTLLAVAILAALMPLAVYWSLRRPLPWPGNSIYHAMQRILWQFNDVFDAVEYGEEPIDYCCTGDMGPVMVDDPPHQHDLDCELRGIAETAEGDGDDR